MHSVSVPTHASGQPPFPRRGLAGLRREAALLVAALGVAGLGACIEPDDEQGLDDAAAPATSEATQALSAFNWTGSTFLANGVWWPQLVTYGNRVFMVHSSPGYVMKWRERRSTNSWSPSTTIPGQETTFRVSLASFNGYIYMLRTDRSQPSRLWLSRFNPTTNQWSSSYQLSLTSYAGPPAMVAFGNVLQLIGVDPSTKKLWRATMNTSETFSPAMPMDGHYSNARVSAAVANCKLYIAHRAGAGDNMVYNSFNGTSWDYDRTIPAGPGGAALQGYEPVIAERSGYLHLIHFRPGSGSYHPLQWTYFDGTSWAPEIQLNVTSAYGPSLTTGGSGLVATATQYYDSPTLTMEYAQALPPRVPLPCFVIKWPPPIVLP